MKVANSLGGLGKGTGAKVYTSSIPSPVRPSLLSPYKNGANSSVSTQLHRTLSTAVTVGPCFLPSWFLSKFGADAGYWSGLGHTPLPLKGEQELISQAGEVALSPKLSWMGIFQHRKRVHMLGIPQKE
jgi:hypothetical protein